MGSRVIEAKPARSKPLAGVSMCISTGERRGFGASAGLVDQSVFVAFYGS